MLSYKERLAEALKYAQVSDTALSKHLGISIQAVRKVAAGTTIAFTAENNSKTAAYLGVSPDWLATGEGSMKSVTSWPGARFTLEQIHEWPQEVVENVESFALGVLLDRESKNSPTRNSSENELPVHKTGARVGQLSTETKQGQIHGSSDSLSTSKRPGKAAS